MKSITAKSSIHARQHHLHRAAAAVARACVEVLEDRRLLSAVAWTGGGDGVRWSQPLNWSTLQVLSAADDVAINVSGNPTIEIDSTAGSAVVHSLDTSEAIHVSGAKLKVIASMTAKANLTVDSGSLTAGSLTLKTGTTTVNGSGTLSADPLTVSSGATFVLNTSVTLGLLHVASGGTVTHAAGNNRFNMRVTGDATIDAGGQINADGKGYDAAEGPGAGESGFSLQFAGGGGYGAAGGTAGTPGSPAYGSETSPDSLGSGGGDMEYWTGVIYPTAHGGRGGGLIHIEVGGRLTVNGSISARGSNGGQAPNFFVGGGGGSGGSVYLRSGAIAGTGTIAAPGGDGGWASDGGGAGGAGGRVAVYFGSYQFASGKFDVSGGRGGHRGGLGTLFSQRTADVPTIGIVATDANAVEPSNSTTTAGDTGLYTILRTGSTASALAVNFAISGVAANGTDYATIASPVTIPAGKSSVTIKLTPKFDTRTEGSETTILTLSASSAYAIDAAKMSATVSINDPTSNSGAISGKLFHDYDGDGAIDPGESPLEGWTVFLDRNNNGVLNTGEPSKATDASGNYRFTGLSGAKYTVRAVAKSGWVATSPADSKLSATVPPGATDRNFGFARPAAFSGSVFHDLNADGFHDSGEKGLSGWRVFIDLDGDGVRDSNEQSVLTDAGGAFSFTNLRPGDLSVRVVVAGGWRTTSPNPIGLRLLGGTSQSGLAFGMKQ